MYFVYILYSSKADRYYVGQTQNLETRLAHHNAGLARWTKAYVPWELKYHEAFESRSEAMCRESENKNQKKRSYKGLFDAYITRAKFS
jgi:putative endonuclease